MRIYSMSATFGKLEHEKLALEPGLNVIQAPNEWGKSTWCAFLTAMLYGLDTRAKTTKTVLADKERFAPWSGSPMEGRIDLCWQGRDITVERKTRRRVPLGEFRAYETATGLDIPELTAANCGEKLLGVERSVFLRAGFIRFADLPVSQDEALRRRLNALVTTGDESATGDRLAGALRDMKNRCRYHKSGLLPQVELQQAELEEKLRQLRMLAAQVEATETRLAQLRQALEALENHRIALRYQAAQADARRVAQAEAALAQAEAALAQANEACRTLPQEAQARDQLEKLQALERQRQALDLAADRAPALPEEPQAPEPFRGLEGEAALSQAAADGHRYRALRRFRLPLPILALVLMAAGGAAVFWQLLPGLIALGLGAALAVAALVLRLRRRARAKALAAAYPTPEPEDWLALAQAYRRREQAYDRAMEAYRAARREQEAREQQLRQQTDQATDGQGLDAARRGWQAVLDAWDAQADASREQQRRSEMLQALRAMARSAEAPALPDALSYTAEETEARLASTRAEQHRLQQLLGQDQGRMEALGTQAELERQLQQLRARIAQLEQTYTALTLAQETLAQAGAQLQRRFAPRIASAAQALMAAFTGGRYDRLSLTQDLDVRSGAEQEETLHDALWRSDGTADQLYLALRLAVAEELTPQAPLVLDDALVRFDDARAQAALRVLQKLGQEKQILLFTCHSREKQLLEAK